MLLIFINFILIISFYFIKCQTSKEIPSIFLNYSDNRNISFNLSILKDEIFEIQYYGNPSTGCYWSFININSFIDTYIQRVSKDEVNNNKNDTLPDEISEDNEQILGKPEIEYNYYKALKTSNGPLILNFNYFSNSDEVLCNNSINLYICDELNDGECIYEKEEDKYEENNTSENILEKESDNGSEKINNKLYIYLLVYFIHYFYFDS